MSSRTLLIVLLSLVAIFMTACVGATPTPVAVEPTTASVVSGGGGASSAEPLLTPATADSTPPEVALAANRSDAPWSGSVVLRASAKDDSGQLELALLLDGNEVASADEGTLSLELTPADTPGMRPGGKHTFTARATDAAGNVAESSLVITVGPLTELAPSPTAPATLPASPPPTPAPSATTSPAVTPTPKPPPPAEPAAEAITSYAVTEITIPTYGYAPYIGQEVDPSLGNYPVPVLDRSAYEGSNPQPAAQTYRLLVLENKYLRLSILPDLGGRLYECVFKPTGNNEFYRNPVIKPTGWGPPSPPYPAGANWWLAAGGMEWGFPVEEHGYEWATSWGYDHVATPDGGVMVTVFTRDPRRPYAVVDIILPPETAYFIVRPRIVNPLDSPFRFKWWHDAMLAPGPANAPGPDLRFIFPTDQVTVHSTGDASLPGPGQPMSWPMYAGRDMSRLGNWTGYLGFFERPAARGGFAGVYDVAVNEGVVRVYPPDVARGSKGFAAGWSTPLDSKNWTDDGSGYVELHGGLAPTFDDWYELAPGGEITWTETWYPVAGIGGVTYAAEGGAVNLVPAGDRLRVGLFPTIPVTGQLVISLPGMEPIVRPVAASPAAPLMEEILYSESVPARGLVEVELVESGGGTVLAYRGEAALR